MSEVNDIEAEETVDFAKPKERHKVTDAGILLKSRRLGQVYILTKICLYGALESGYKGLSENNGILQFKHYLFNTDNLFIPNY